MHRDPAEAVWLRSLANSERRRLQSAQTPGMNTETLCSMNYGCNTVSAANAADIAAPAAVGAAPSVSARVHAPPPATAPTVEMRASDSAASLPTRPLQVEPVDPPDPNQWPPPPPPVVPVRPDGFAMASGRQALAPALASPRPIRARARCATTARISSAAVQEVPPLSSLRDSTRTWPYRARRTTRVPQRTRRRLASSRRQRMCRRRQRPAARAVRAAAHP